ncbi:MAG TPA: GNAT family N-acetyltransferase [Acholeplasmataceae bacterium]|nr:GNAT family N-acetyltransferase [Acholeplasmataceae bacterium]
MKFLKMKEVNHGIRSELSKIFVDCFYVWLKYFTKNKEKLVRTFEHIFVDKAFYVAVEDGKVLSMAACVPNHSRAVKMNKKEFKKHLGFIKGQIAYLILHKEFEVKEYPLEIPNHMGKIEFVATSVDARGKGVAYKLLQHIIETTNYEEYVLEVASNNEKAIKLYTRLGFEEIKRVPQKNAKQSGFEYLIYMQLKK